MALPVLFAVDSSGSTSGSAVYHDRVHKLYKELVAKVPSVHVALWSSTWLDADNQSGSRMPTVDEYCKARSWNSGGTDPKLVADYLKRTKFAGHLVLVTDGQVPISSVERCDELANHFKHASCDVVVINTSSTSAADFTVAAPFTRGREFALTTYNHLGEEVNMERVRVDAKCLELLRTVGDAASFEKVLARFDDVEAAVAASVIGTAGNQQLADSLIRLNKRVIAHEANARLGATTDLLTEAVRARDLPGAAEMARRMHDEYHVDSDVAMTLQARVSRLVAMCQGINRDTRIRGLNPARVQRATNVTATSADMLDDSTTGLASRFECPIMGDDETDVLVLVAGDGPGLFDALPAATADRLAQFPLSALGMKDVMDLIGARIDHVVSLAAARSFFAATGRSLAAESPVTRRPLVGALALGPDASHAAATDYTVSQLLHPSAKKLGNLDLWFFVVARAVESRPYLAGNTALVDRLHEHMRWRLRNRTSFASLSGLPNVVLTRVPLDVAVWWVVNAPAAVPTLAPANDPLRAHVFDLAALLALADLADLAMLPAAVPHARRLRAVLKMLAMSKQDLVGLDDMVRGLVQASLPPSAPGAKRVFLDGPSDSAKAVAATPWGKHLSAAEIMALRACVSPQYSGVDVRLKVNFVAPSLPSAVVEWPFMAAQPVSRVAICPETMRPFFELEGALRTWRDVVTNKYGVAFTHVLPTAKLYADFVHTHERYPGSEAELLDHVYMRVCSRVAIPHTTLPANARELVASTMADYAEVIQGVEPAEFVRRAHATADVEVRVAHEREWKRARRMEVEE